jgi:hypothetical protein
MMRVSGLYLIGLNTLCGFAVLIVVSLSSLWWEYWWVTDVIVILPFLFGLSRDKVYAFFGLEQEQASFESIRWKTGMGVLLLANIILLVVFWPIGVLLMPTSLSYFTTPLMMVALIDFEELGWFMISKHHQNVASSSKR